MHLRLIDSLLDFPGQPCALRERVPSAARRVRVSRQFIYGWPIPWIDAQPESPPIAANLDRCGTPDVVGSARSAFVEVQVSPPASNRSLHSRLRMHPAPARHRNGRQSACRQSDGRLPNSLARKSGLERDPFLEQRCSRQSEWSNCSDLVHSGSSIDPHPPIPAGWAPPSPAMRERGCFG
jgi:hypothetical protein